MLCKKQHVKTQRTQVKQPSISRVSVVSVMPVEPHQATSRQEPEWNLREVRKQADDGIHSS